MAHRGAKRLPDTARSIDRPVAANHQGRNQPDLTRGPQYAVIAAPINRAVTMARLIRGGMYSMNLKQMANHPATAMKLITWPGTLLRMSDPLRIIRIARAANTTCPRANAEWSPK